MTTTIWLNDPTILLRNDKLCELWPNSNMNSSERINAITRLVIFLVFIGYLITLKLNIIWIGVATLAIILILYYIQKDKNNKHEEFSNNLTDSNIYKINKNNFQNPEKSNPLMNLTLPQIYYEPNRKSAAPSFLPEVEKKINNSVKEFVSDTFDDPKIKNKLFADLGDELVFNRSMIQYNSMPNTQVPNDRKAFQEYLYGNMISGKDGHPIALQRNQAGSYNYVNP
tara:strand:+ start:102 stop:779 length:678 start_codon:yes stop_codon:yes gene_type:complete